MQRTRVTLSTSHNDPRFDERAIAYAREHDLPMSAGSDVHSTLMLGGGIAFQMPLVSGRDYAERIPWQKRGLCTDERGSMV